MRLSDLNIRKKMFFVFGVSALFMAGIVLAGFFGILSMKKAVDHFHKDILMEFGELGTLKESLERTRRATLMAINERDREKREGFEEEAGAAIASVDETLARVIEEDAFDRELKAMAREFKWLWEGFKQTRAMTILPALKAGKAEEALEAVHGVQQERFRKMAALAQGMTSFENGEALTEKGRVDRLLAGSVGLYASLMAAGLAVSVALLLFIARDIGGRLKAVEDGVRAVQEGKLDLEVKVAGRDEIANLARGFNIMSRRLYEDSIARDQYMNILEWDGLEREKRARELEELNSTLSRAQAELTEKNRSLEEKIEEVRAANRKIEDAKAQMLQSEKLASIGLLAAGIAHEINNPLGFVNSNINTLSGYIEDIGQTIRLYEQASVLTSEGEKAQGEETLGRARQLAKELEIDFELEDSGRLLDESRDGIGRILSIVKGLKGFAHNDTGESFEEDLNECIDNVIRIAWNEIKYKADLRKDYGILPPVLCRPQQISQVLMNIIVNAAQAIPEKGLIRVSTYADGGFAVVQIADNGTGMDEEVKKKIFDPFFTTKPVGKGTGLGLSIAYGIVREHRGEIIVESCPGQGTTFKVKLPLERDSALKAS